MKNRILSFDIMRGLAAFAVMLYHYTCRYGEMEELSQAPTDFGFSITWGFAAVSLFFILSGYFSAKQLFDEKPIDWGEYFSKRVKRLYPAFFISVIITFIVTSIWLPVLSCSFKDFLLNLTMIPGPVGAKPVDGAYWTLFVEWIFYFIVATLLIKPNKRISRYVLIGWLIISIVSNLVGGTSPSGLFKVINYCLVTSYSSCFVAGIALWQLGKHIRDIYTYLYLILSSFNVMLWQNLPSIIFFFVTCIIIVLITHLNLEDYLVKSRIANILAWYGRISYPFYLLHQVLGYVMIFYLVKVGFTNAWILLVPFVVISVLAYLLNTYSEIMLKKALVLIKKNS